MQVYEQLLDIDSNLAIVPQLAVAWKIIDPTDWEFDLRQAVTFHDGTPFSASDVVFSINRARAEASAVRTLVDNIAAISGVDDHTIHITTTAPDPLLWMRLSNVAIMSERWALAHDAGSPANVDAGEETFASRHSNGTGPFMLQEFEPHGRWVEVRNPSWWGTSARDPHEIDRVVHVYSSDEKNVAALLDGEIDLLQGPSYSELDRIRKTPDLKIVFRPKFHTAFFGLDQASPELRTSNVKGKNPFQDRRVREAMAHALDMKSALNKLMGELFIPAGMVAAPGMNGYASDLDRPVPYDPERAKVLLAEAGYPNGFKITLDCPDQWGDDEISECKAAARQLGSVGISVSVNFMSTSDLLAKVETRHDSDFFLDSWPMDPDSERVLRELFQSHNGWNVSGYSNPRIDELLDKIRGEMVTYARDAYLEEAWRIVTGDLVYLPIRHGVSVFAMRKNLEIPPDPWDVPRFRLARFTGPTH
jgi:peptide/nickel transport system substrate-binding protein